MMTLTNYNYLVLNNDLMFWRLGVLKDHDISFNLDKTQRKLLKIRTADIIWVISEENETHEDENWKTKMRYHHGRKLKTHVKLCYS